VFPRRRQARVGFHHVCAKSHGQNIKAVSGRQHFGHDGFHQPVIPFLGLFQLGFQIIAQGHELIDFGDDAFLLVQRKRSGNPTPTFLPGAGLNVSSGFY
jgi:hypothetical protein